MWIWFMRYFCCYNSQADENHTGVRRQYNDIVRKRVDM